MEAQPAAEDTPVDDGWFVATGVPVPPRADDGHEPIARGARVGAVVAVTIAIGVVLGVVVGIVL